MRIRGKVLSSLVRRFYPYGGERRVLLGPLKGYRYIVEPGHGFSYAIGKGSYNFDFLAGYVHEGMTIYDIGANCGQVTIFFSKLIGASGIVHAFEPAPIPFASLRRNIALNGLTNVNAWQFAVSNRNGDQAFTFFADRPTEGKFERLAPGAQSQTGESFYVPCVTLDSFVQQRNQKPDILKIDVEGGAATVLEGARETIEDAAPSVYVELHDAEEQRAIRDELQSRGYQCRTMSGRKVVDPTSGWASPLWCWQER